MRLELYKDLNALEKQRRRAIDELVDEQLTAAAVLRTWTVRNGCYPGVDFIIYAAVKEAANRRVPHGRGKHGHLSFSL